MEILQSSCSKNTGESILDKVHLVERPTRCVHYIYKESTPLNFFFTAITLSSPSHHPQGSNINMFGFGKALIASLLASGALALPKAQTNTNGNTDPNNMKSPTTGQTTEQVKSQGVPGKIGENPPLPPVSDVGPAYSLLLAKEM